MIIIFSHFVGFSLLTEPETYNRPGYTIESGIREISLPISQFDEIYKEVQN